MKSKSFINALAAALLGSSAAIPVIPNSDPSKSGKRKDLNSGISRNTRNRTKTAYLKRKAVALRNRKRSR